MEAMMQEIFISVFNMSVTASWLVLAIVLVRFAFKKRLKGFCCILWALVGIRLVCPFSVESIASLIPSAEVVSPEIMMEDKPTIQTGVGVIDGMVNPIISEALAATPHNSVNPMQVVTSVAAAVWVIGMVLMLLYSLISYLSLQMRVRASMQVQGGDKNIYVCDSIDSPFILGIIRPHIFLPSDMSKEYQSSVIAHEKAHLARKDHWWKPMGFLLLTIHWFNPLMWVAYILLCKDIELACDERVIKEMADEEKKQYSKALLSCSVSHKLVVACPLSFGEVAVKDRIKSVLHYKKPAFWILVAAAVASLVVIIGFMTNPKDGVTISEASMEVSQRKIVVTDGYTNCEGVSIRLQEFTYSVVEEEMVPTVVLDIVNTTGEAFVYGREFHVFRDGFGGRYSCAMSEETWFLDAKAVPGENFERTISLWKYDISKKGHYYIEFEFTLGKDKTSYRACVEFDVEIEKDTENDKFYGKIIEQGDGYLLVEPLEGDAIRNSADQISVDVSFWEGETWKPEHLKEGAEICVVYDGKIAESYPAQVKASAIYEWTENGSTRDPIDMNSAKQNLYRVPWSDECTNLFYAESENNATMMQESNYHQVPVQKIDTWDEWQEFQNTYSVAFADTELQQNSQMYDKAFFEKHSLIFLYVMCSSGSYEITVNDFFNNGYICYAFLQARIPGEIATADEANWLCSFEVKKDWIEYCSYFDSWIEIK